MVEGLEPRLLLSAGDMVTTMWADDISDQFLHYFQPAFVAEGRIGDAVGGGGTHEIDVAESTAGPFEPGETGDYEWTREEEHLFLLRYTPGDDAVSGTVTWSVAPEDTTEVDWSGPSTQLSPKNGKPNEIKTVSHQSTWDDAFFYDSIFLRTGNYAEASSSELRNVELYAEASGDVDTDDESGVTILKEDGTDPSSNDDYRLLESEYELGGSGDSDCLQITGFNLREGFVLAGKTYLDWDAQVDEPRQSDIAFQVKVGTWRPPVIPSYQGTQIPGDVAGGAGTTFGADGMDPGAIGRNTDAMRFYNGEVFYGTTDLASGADGIGWGHSRYYANQLGYKTTWNNGRGWVIAQQPFMVKVQSEWNARRVAVISGPNNIRWFKIDNGGNVISPDAEHEFFLEEDLTYDAAANEYVLTDSIGNVSRFYGFDQTKAGKLKKFTDAGGHEVTIHYRAGTSEVDCVERQLDGGATETWDYFYEDTGHPELITKLEWKRDDQTIRTAEYTYKTDYQDASLVDVADLTEVVIKDGSGTILDKEEYTYTYEEGFGYTLLKTVKQGANIASGGYPDHEFAYDELGRVTSHTFQGGGSSSYADKDARGTVTYEYSRNARSLDPLAKDLNRWHYKTVETRPDGSKLTAYANQAGEIMLKHMHVRESKEAKAAESETELTSTSNSAVSADVTPGDWRWFWKYDEDGRIVLEAMPSAITGHDEQADDLLVWLDDERTTEEISQGVDVYAGYDYLKNSDGLLGSMAYTNGLLSTVHEMHGEQATGLTKPKQAEYTYSAASDTIDQVNVSINLLGSATGYRNEDGTGATTTSYSYSSFQGVRPGQIITELPSRNGQGDSVSAEITETFDEYGRLVQRLDPTTEAQPLRRRHTWSYDGETGALTAAVTDADGGQLAVVYEALDDVGRAGIVKRYHDYTGSNTGTLYSITTLDYEDGFNTSSVVVTPPNGPSSEYTINREDASTQSSLIVENPDETISRFTRTLDYYDQAGQTVRIDQFLTIDDETPANEERFSTDFAHDGRGRWNKSTMEGVTSVTKYDPLHQPIGSSQIGSGGASEVTTGLNVFDDGQDGGDGNLTKTETVYGDQAGESIVSIFSHDWRNRLTNLWDSTRLGMENLLDNLGRITEMTVVKEQQASSNLSSSSERNVDVLSKTAAHYDNWGAIYRTEDFAVEDGSPTSETLETNYWHDNLGRTYGVQGPDGTYYESAFNSLGHVTRQSTLDAPEGNLLEVSGYNYDPQGRLTETLAGTSEQTLQAVSKVSYHTLQDATDPAAEEQYRVVWSGSRTANDTPSTADDWVWTWTGYDAAGRVSQTLDNLPDGFDPDNPATIDSTRTVYTYDALGRVLRTQTFHATDFDRSVGTDELLTQTEATYDGSRLQTTTEYEVEAGVATDSLTTTYEYDDLGRQYKTIEADGSVSVTEYDRIGRVVGEYLCADDNDTATITDDLVVEQTLYTYDDVGRAWLTTSAQRDHWDSVSLGQLDDSFARVTYHVNWFNDRGEILKSVEYGTNHGNEYAVIDDKADDFDPEVTGIQTYDADMGDGADNGPAVNRSDFYIATEFGYDAFGRRTEVTDNLGRTTKTVYNEAGRREFVIENYKANVQGGTQYWAEDVDGNELYDQPLSRSSDVNRITKYVYNDLGLVTQQIAVDPDADGVYTDNQTTAYTYGSDPRCDRADLLLSITYPDGDSVSYTYYANGRKRSVTDQRGTERTYTYDSRGRLIADTVTTLGSDTDDSVLAVTRQYDDHGRLTVVSSHDTATSDPGDTASMINQVAYEYDGWGNLISHAQDHSDEVDPTSPTVTYAYEDGAEAPGDDTAEFVRQTSVTYPNGQHTTHYNYATDVIGAPLNRIQNIASDDAGVYQYADYTYLGAGTIVEVDSPEVTGGLTLSYIGAGQGDYSGFDQFGRIVWQKWSGDAGAFQYGYDRGSNVTFRADRTQSRLTGQDQAYQHDDLGRLTEFRRGVVQAPDEGFLAPLPADFDMDGQVGSSDYSILSSHMWTTGRGFSQGDATGDGSVDGSDYSVFSSWMNSDFTHGLVAHYRFNGDATDESAEGNDLTPNGSITYTDNGRVAEAVELDGQSYLADDTPTGLDFAPGSFTLAAWVNVEDVATNQWQAILEYDRWDGSGDRTNWLGMWVSPSGNLHFRVGGDTVESPAALDGQEWVFVAATYDSTDSTATLYVNHESVASAVLTPGNYYSAAGQGRLTVGGNNNGNEEFAGEIDQVRIFDRELEAEDVQALSWDYAKAYDLDQTGNRTATTTGDGTETRTHNAANEIETIDGSGTSSQYDAAGNMIRIPILGSHDEFVHATYDAWNRLIELREDDNGQPGDVMASFEYDGQNKRIVSAFTDDQGLTTTTEYYYNANWQVLEERITRQTAVGTEQEAIQYVWSQRYIDTPICRLRDAEGDGTFEETLYYVTDAQHNVTAMVAENGQVVERYAYDPYGRVLVLNGENDPDGAEYTPDADGLSDVGNVILYAGYRFDAASGLYQVRRRYHHPTLGRWINRDPKGYVDGMNLYQYVASRPTAATDPMGLQSMSAEEHAGVEYKTRNPDATAVDVADHVSRTVGRDPSKDPDVISAKKKEARESVPHTEMDWSVKALLINTASDGSWKWAWQDWETVRENQRKHHKAVLRRDIRKVEHEIKEVEASIEEHHEDRKYVESCCDGSDNVPPGYTRMWNKDLDRLHSKRDALYGDRRKLLRSYNKKHGTYRASRRSDKRAVAASEMNDAYKRIDEEVFGPGYIPTHYEKQMSKEPLPLSEEAIRLVSATINNSRRQSLNRPELVQQYICGAAWLEWSIVPVSSDQCTTIDVSSKAEPGWLGWSP